MPVCPARIFHIDAFTDQVFRGNPAVVCLLEAQDPRVRDTAWMQRVAAEFGLPEAAFVHREGSNGTARWRLRWFSPLAEIALCGHGTLAAAHALVQAQEHERSNPLTFATQGGTLTATVGADVIELDLPAQPPQEVPPNPSLTEALGTEPRWLGRAGERLIAELASDRAVLDLQPDFSKLKQLVDTEMVVVTAEATANGFDFVSRCFAPRTGVDEDHVSGSTHCMLGPYWAPRRKRNDLVGFQASSRDGVVEVQVRGERVKLRGHAVTIYRGELMA